MIYNIGIIGSGKMGSDIFNYLSDFDFKLSWFILFEDEKDSLQKSFNRKISRQLKHELINQEQYNKKCNYVLTNDLSDFASCDLIIESIVEEKNVKIKLFKDLENIVKSDCILVSNSSSILPSILSDNISVIGMHFFYPVAFKNIVELIIPENIENEKVNQIQLFLSSINKIAFEQDEHNAFVLNRFLLDIQLRAYELVKEYDIKFSQLDEIAKEIISDFGLFEMMDSVGHQTMYNSISNYAKMEDDQSRFDILLKELKERMKTQSRFSEETESKELQNDLMEKIKNALHTEANTTIENYIKRFKIERATFYNSLNDTCGLII